MPVAPRAGGMVNGKVRDLSLFILLYILKFEPCKSTTYSENYWRGFPGVAVVKNLPANAGDIGSSPGPGRSYMPWSN